ncbi:MAG: glycosyltransferase family 4 protein [Symploca sp. SIO2G7]|nr:glycosyltransferase family 4 protein [Symploca sp. SIO2G7]
MSIDNLRVLIVAENASLKFGGEAALPLHYFRGLRERGIETWLVVHDRTRKELESFFLEDFSRIHFVPDTVWHRILAQCNNFLPSKLYYVTFGFILRLMTQIVQRLILKRLVKELQIDIIHQPIPVSPKEPSMIFGMGIPVVMGPMNGGMNYPPSFRRRESKLVNLSVEIGRLFANSLNTLIPGKRQATTLLVANQRTQEALPKGICGEVIELVENGVDLSIWKPKFENQGSELESREKAKIDQLSQRESQQRTKFVFVGRLVDWKAVDLLLIAFKQVLEQMPVELEIIGNGSQRTALEAQAKELGLIAITSQGKEKTSDSEGESPERTAVCFSGRLSQADCAQRLLSSDALVLPSLFECGGAVVLEAMSVGIPVIATNWGGPADYLDQSCGILVEPASRDSFISNLAAAMIKIAQQPELRLAMGKAGHQRVVNYFDWRVKIDTILEIYQGAIKKYAGKQKDSVPNVHQIEQV